ncbi:MAG: hypothetical protein HQL84_16360 [Magnetococcales bacterium]|nr:hypothetical protein [Magnetococcales bacterium]MBF0171810.1 hypothetical protein [Magnetococcales bacterium]MBF0348725.1 hypothetical protein [Magnetococcales bacterium]
MDRQSHSKLADVPPLEVSDAAWIAGIAVDAMERFIAENHLSGDHSIHVTELLHTAFHLLGYKQLQIDLLTRQLQAALNRERELIQGLQSRLGIPLQPSVDRNSAPPLPPMATEEGDLPHSSLPKEKKKGGKKKKKGGLFP